jgi:hypothetical protein
LIVIGRRACIIDDSTYYSYRLPGQASDVVRGHGDTYCLEFAADSVTPAEAPYVALFHVVDSLAGIDTVVLDTFVLPTQPGSYVAAGDSILFDFRWEKTENPWFWLTAEHTAPSRGYSRTVMRRGTGEVGDTLRFVWRWEP